MYRRATRAALVCHQAVVDPPFAIARMVYARFADTFLLLHRFGKGLGYGRVEPRSSSSKTRQGFMFDCRMCGQCILSSTGMSCPMNCPSSAQRPLRRRARQRQLRGRAGYARVWVKAWEGSQNMVNNDKILTCRSGRPVVARNLRLVRVTRRRRSP